MHASHLMPKAQVRIPPHKQARSSHPFTGGEKIAIPILVTGAAGCVGGVGRTVTELMHQVIAGCETMCFLMLVSDTYLAAMVNTAAVAKHHGVKAFINMVLKGEKR